MATDSARPVALNNYLKRSRRNGFVRNVESGSRQMGNSALSVEPNCGRAIMTIVSTIAVIISPNFNLRLAGEKSGTSCSRRLLSPIFFISSRLLLCEYHSTTHTTGSKNNKYKYSGLANLNMLFSFYGILSNKVFLSTISENMHNRASSANGR